MKFELRIHDLKLEIDTFLKRSGKSEGILKNLTGNFLEKVRESQGKVREFWDRISLATMKINIFYFFRILKAAATPRVRFANFLKESVPWHAIF